MSVVYVMTTPIPEDGGDDTIVEQIRKRAKWDNDDYVYRGLILNGSHLRIEESLRAQDNDKPKCNNVASPSVVNMVEHNNSSRYNDNKAGNVVNKANGSGTKGLVDGSSNSLKGQNMFNKSLQVYYVTYVSEAYFVQDSDVSWWVDSGATVHVKEALNASLLDMLSIPMLLDSFQSLDQVSGFQMELKTSLKGTRDEVSDQHSYCFNVDDDPKTFDEAIKSQDVAFKKKAINDEMYSIMGKNTWVLADLPPGCKPLGCKWIFKRKLKVDGTIEKFKARLVIQGFKQKSGIDYFDTYAPVARISTIRLLIAMASIHNLIIHQMDVKTAFLNGELDEEVYMNQPQGFIMPGNENKVCKLIKSLYGLKQAPKQWHQKFDEVVLSNGYLLNQADKCVYSKFDESGKGVIICLYVDDMLIFGTDQVQVDLTKEFLSSRFSIKDIGEDDVILSIRIKHESNGIAISESHYIEKVLKKFNYFDCTPISTPIDTSEKLMPNNGQAVSQLKYSMVIGYQMYAMTCTRPDIAFVVGKLSRYTSNPRTQHWQAIQRVLKYLKKTMDYKLTYTSYPSMLEGYTDASWISNTEDNSSICGEVFLLGGGAIS
ncbi:zinc finger, CCHC-type containing protein [Tanacetum coccineum]